MRGHQHGRADQVKGGDARLLKIARSAASSAACSALGAPPEAAICAPSAAIF